MSEHVEINEEYGDMSSTSEIIVLKHPDCENLKTNKVKYDEQAPDAVEIDPNEVKEFEFVDKVTKTQKEESTNEEALVENGAYRNFFYIGELGRMNEIKPKYAGAFGYRPDNTIDRIDVGKLTLGAVSLRGIMHQDLAKPRQDALAFSVTDDRKYLIAAIADGVSAATLSHIGADFAVSAILKLINTVLKKNKESLNDIDWQSIYEDLHAQFIDRSAKLAKQGLFKVIGKANPAKYAEVLGTTAEALIIAIQPDKLGKHDFLRVVFAGDGSGYTLDPEKGWCILSSGKDNSGEIADSSVVPLPIECEGAPWLFAGHISENQAVMIATDGIGDLGIGSENDTSVFLQKMLSRPASSIELLKAFSVLIRYKDDDRTAVIVWVS